MSENRKILSVLSKLKDSNPIDENDGKKLYEEINKIRNANTEDMIYIDFQGIESFTTAFINRSIAEFVLEEGINSVSKWMRISGIRDKEQDKTIRFSLSLAQEKYQTKKNGNNR